MSKPLPQPYYVTVDEGGGKITLEFKGDQATNVAVWADNLNLLVASPLLLDACKRLLHHIKTNSRLKSGEPDPRISKSIRLGEEAIQQSQPES